MEVRLAHAPTQIVNCKCRNLKRILDDEGVARFVVLIRRRIEAIRMVPSPRNALVRELVNDSTVDVHLEVSGRTAHIVERLLVARAIVVGNFVI